MWKVFEIVLNSDLPFNFNMDIVAQIAPCQIDFCRFKFRITSHDRVEINGPVVVDIKRIVDLHIAIFISIQQDFMIKSRTGIELATGI